MRAAPCLLSVLLACAPEPSTPGTAPDEQTRPALDESDTSDEALSPVSVSVALPDLSGYPSPLPGAVLDSGFGPRRVSSDGGRDDFHLGLDLDAPEGTDVLAIAEGEVWRVNAADGDSSNSLYLAHPLPQPFTWHGEEIETFYAVYSHLSGFAVEEGEAVSPGQTVGFVGTSGDVVEPHLHFEIRLGTWCSLRYATENPDSSCGRDYDPAINPLRLIPGQDPELPEVWLERTGPLQIRVRVAEGDFDIARIATPHGEVDFDQRLGMDATTDEGLDCLDYGWLAILPDADSAEVDWQAMTLEPADDPAWVEVTDINGQGWRLSL